MVEPLQLVQSLPRLRRYARLLTGDVTRADDLVQDTVERALSRQSQWRAGSDLRAWLFSIMHNVYISELRRPGTRLESAFEDGQSEAVAASQWGPEARAELSIDLQRVLLLLPDEQRAVLLLVSVEELRYEDAAQVLCIPVGTVMSRLARARSRLRELWEPVAAPAPGVEPGQRVHLKVMK
jgi:RNA polymerase sigma-70 factor (ECF subfamily)